MLVLPAESTALTLPPGLEVLPRLEPPLHLSDAARAVWLQAVNAQPADSFSPVHVPLLEAYCGHIVRMRVLNDQVENFNIEWISRADGLERYNRLLAMIERESRAASSLATRLRITRQAADESRTAGAKNARERAASITSKPWQA